MLWRKEAEFRHSAVNGAGTVPGLLSGYTTIFGRGQNLQVSYAAVLPRFRF